MTMLKAIRWTAWALVGVFGFLALATGVGWFRVEVLPGPAREVATGAPELGGPFTLVNHRGETVTQEDFLGRPTAYFFGFTHCPEICPTTLFEMTSRLDELGPAAERLNVVFVTVDPERDTPEHLARYLESFDPRIVGLSGTAEQVADAARTFGITYRKVPLEGGEYTMDHTASVLLFDETGRLATLIDYHDSPDAALGKLRRVVGADA